MLFSRSSLELNKLWEQQARHVTESDAARRRAERNMRKDPGDIVAQARDRIARARTDDHEIIMAPHVEAFNKADAEVKRATRLGSGYSNGDRREAFMARDRARNRLHQHAAETDKSPGEFFKARPGESHAQHHHRIAAASGDIHSYRFGGRESELPNNNRRWSWKFHSPGAANHFANAMRATYVDHYVIDHNKDGSPADPLGNTVHVSSRNGEHIFSEKHSDR